MFKGAQRAACARGVSRADKAPGGNLQTATVKPQDRTVPVSTTKARGPWASGSSAHKPHCALQVRRRARTSGDRLMAEKRGARGWAVKSSARARENVGLHYVTPCRCPWG
jgi:hypothetical protein